MNVANLANYPGPLKLEREREGRKEGREGGREEGREEGRKETNMAHMNEQRQPPHF